MSTETIRHAPELQARMTLSVLWIAVTLCYAYADIIGFFLPGALRMLLQGRMGPWPVSQGLLLGVAVMMAVSPVMALVSIALQGRIVRALNVAFGLVFLVVALASTVWSLRLGNLHYVFFSALEGVMNGLIVWFALRGPGRGERA